MQTKIRLGLLFQCTMVWGVSVSLGLSLWLSCVPLLTLGITLGAGRVLEQGIATGLLLLFPAVLLFFPPHLLSQHPTRMLSAGFIGGLVTGWLVSALLEWFFAIPLRKWGVTTSSPLRYVPPRKRL